MMFFVKECSFVSILLTKERLSVVCIECFITAIYEWCSFYCSVQSGFWAMP